MVSDYVYYFLVVGSFCRSIEKWINYLGVGDVGVVVISSECSFDWFGRVVWCLIVWSCGEKIGS